MKGAQHEHESRANPTTIADFYPYSEIGTRQTILQRREDSGWSEEKAERDEKRRDSLDAFAEQERLERVKIQDGTMAAADAIIASLEQKGGAFLHTTEYYAAIEERAERMRAYQGITVSNRVPDGEETEIRKNPFAFLGLPEDATFGQARAKWLHLSRIWHQDTMRPDDRQKFNLIFGGDTPFVVEAIDPNAWHADLEKFVPPMLLSVEEMTALSSEERVAYEARLAAHQKKEQEYEAVKSEMVLRAHDKSSKINIAFHEIKQRFSREETNTIVGFRWQQASLDYELGFSQRYECLPLEGDGELRKYKKIVFTPADSIDTNDETIYLKYDMGDVYMADSNNYRQASNIHALFAWIELVQMNEISSLLLVNMAKEYSLNPDQVEQLRLMISNHEDPLFIVKALCIDTDKKQHLPLVHFVEEIYDGPVYVHDFIGRHEISHKTGVELTAEGGMVLRYEAQFDHYTWAASPNQAHFTPADMQLMRSVAYGPLLAG